LAIVLAVRNENRVLIRSKNLVFFWKGSTNQKAQHNRKNKVKSKKQ